MFILLTISALFVLFLLSAFFSASETVLFSLTPLQVRRLKDRSPAVGARVVRWREDPSRVLSSILAGNTLVNFAIAGIGYLLLERTVPGYAEVGVPRRSCSSTWRTAWTIFRARTTAPKPTTTA